MIEQIQHATKGKLPVADGLYLCYVENLLHPKYPDRKILLWHGRWCEPYYAEKPYSFPVYGWVAIPILEKSFFFDGPPDAKMYDL